MFTNGQPGHVLQEINLLHLVLVVRRNKKELSNILLV